MSKIPVGVSQCLLGEPVRYDGGHKHNAYITGVLAGFFELRPQCPEVAIGLGVPRQPIRLVHLQGETRVLGVKTPELDVTDQLVKQGEVALAQMPDICGYIFMQKSPSCGLYAVKRYALNGYAQDTRGRGAYAEAVIKLMPWLPVEEAGRLNDAALRENFITRVFALNDWKESVAKAPSAKKLLDFYSRYKYQIMAHQVSSYYAIGRYLANMRERDLQISCDEFFKMFMQALSHQATRRGNTNVMMHLRGYLKKIITPLEKQEISHLIESYHAGLVPIVVPLTLLKHHLLKLDNPYLKTQTFWSPYPEKLGLRNHIVENP